MVRVGILGSCVTRDAVSLLGESIAVIWYQARTSIPSMVSSPIDLPLTYAPGSAPPFEQRNAHLDLAKSWISNIYRDDYDCLLLDFIDERFGCSSYKGSLFTWSTSFRAGHVPAEVEAEFSWVSPLSEAYEELIRLHIGQFVDRLRETGKTIICNDVLWTFPNGNHPVYDRFPLARFSRMNNVLSYIYDYLEREECIKMLGFREHRLTLDLEHRWGMAPFHYDRASNARIASELNKALKPGL